MSQYCYESSSDLTDILKNLGDPQRSMGNTLRSITFQNQC